MLNIFFLFPLHPTRMWPYKPLTEIIRLQVNAKIWFRKERKKKNNNILLWHFSLWWVPHNSIIKWNTWEDNGAGSTYIALYGKKWETTYIKPIPFSFFLSFRGVHSSFMKKPAFLHAHLCGAASHTSSLCPCSLNRNNRGNPIILFESQKSRTELWSNLKSHHTYWTNIFLSLSAVSWSTE